MGPRLALQAILVDILGSSERVYFQPPANAQVKYPCITYELDDQDTKYADNKAYLRTKKYQVTVIDRNPDSDIPDKVADLPLTSFDRRFVSDNLNHDVFSVYF